MLIYMAICVHTAQIRPEIFYGKYIAIGGKIKFDDFVRVCQTINYLNCISAGHNYVTGQLQVNTYTVKIK